mgnify:CR=1 FL=1
MGSSNSGRGKGRRRAPPWTPPLPEPPSSTGWFPTWETSRNQHRDLETAYASSVRMSGRAGTALLIDTGSPGNLVGSEWSKEMTLECDRAGINWPVYHQRDGPLNCSGIGTGSQQEQGEGGSYPRQDTASLPPASRASARRTG